MLFFRAFFSFFRLEKPLVTPTQTASSGFYGQLRNQRAPLGSTFTGKEFPFLTLPAPPLVFSDDFGGK